MRKIILLIDCASEFDRTLLRGMIRYSKERGPWLFYRMPMNLREDLDGGRNVIDWAKRWKADAIVGRWKCDNTSILSSLDIPVVLQNYKARSSNFSNLTGDYTGTGMLAAQFFGKRKYRNFAYFGVRNVIWSEERLQGYREEIKKQGGVFHSLLVDDSYAERDKILTWLRALSKPVAMFACDDAYALFLTEMCKVEGISIPHEVSLLGVDNDELLCQISDPTISSIALNVEQGGFRTCEMLDKQFKSNEIWSFNIVINCSEVIQRNSTRKHDIKDPYIDKLVRYIDDNFDQYITTGQILSQIPMSRRNLEIRFKKEMEGMTIYRYLSWCRMQRFAHLLATTDYSITEIAELCGTIDFPNISRTFKKIFGCTPKEYRQRKKKEQSF